MSLRKGFTEDGLEYRIYYDGGDNHVKVEFCDAKKEIWVLEEEVDKRAQAEILAARISYRLEHDGSWVIRGVRATRNLLPEAMIKVPATLPFGSTRLVLDRAVPLVTRIGVIERERKEVVPRRLRVPLPSPKPPPKPPKLVSKGYGLGSTGRRRLRVLFSSTLQSLGVKVTKAMSTKAEEVIYQLDVKYKATPRDEAVEVATNDFLKWVERTYYLAS